MKRILFLSVLLSTSICYSQTVTTVTLAVAENSFTDSGNPSSLNNTATTSSVYVTSTAYYRAFYKFNLGSIPPKSVIVSAMLILTPSGTENVTASNSNELWVDVCNSDWLSTNLTHNSGISNNIMVLPVAISNLDLNGKRNIQLASHVQAMVDGRIPNYGWRIRRNPEGTATLTTRYASKVHINSASRPQLEVKYYTPATVSAATVVHASSGSSNGSISPTIVGGSSTTRSYQWYSAGTGTITPISGTAGTSLNLTSRPAGWYGLKSWGTTPEDTLFQAFLIGTKCDMTEISFNPGPDYIDDAMIYNYTAGSGLSTQNYSQSNSGGSNTIIAEQWLGFDGIHWYNKSSLLKFKLWVDPALEFLEAKMTLSGAVHTPLDRTNESKITQIASYWKETGVSYSIRPALGTISVNLANMPSGNGNSIIELKDFFNFWKNDNINNFGLDFSLQNYLTTPTTGAARTRQSYYSSDNASNRPMINFKVSIVNGCDLNSYARFRESLDASFVRTIQGQLKIQFNEDYDQKAGRFTKLVLYDAVTNIRKAGINNDGSIIATGVPLLPSKLLEFDYNQHVLSLTAYSLVIGNTYVLELTNSVGEKTFIKFKYYN